MYTTVAFAIGTRLFGVGTFVGLIYHASERRAFDPIGRQFFSKYAEWLGTFGRNFPSPETAREIFHETPNVATKEQENHTHPRSASIRNSAVYIVEEYAKLLGVDTYYVQRSAADVRSGRSGCRSYYWAKDFTAPCSGFNPKSGDLCAIMDTDYHMDMPMMLGTYPSLYAISTFQPTTVAASLPEYSFTFDKAGRLDYRVSGGATYKHHLWDYGTDVLVASSKRWCGLWYDVTAYHVERRSIDDHHVLLILIPFLSLHSPLIDISKYIEGHRLKKFDVVDGEFLRMYVRNKDQMLVSTGKVGAWSSTSIDVKIDDAIANYALDQSGRITAAGIKPLLNTDFSPHEALFLANYHRNKTSFIPPMVYPVEHSVYKYQFDPESFDPDAKPSLKPFMSPFILGGCYAPDSCENNDKRMVNGRVVEVRLKNKEIKDLSQFELSVINEFVELLLPHPGMLHPVDIDEVYQRQNRPSQRNIIDAAVRHCLYTVKRGVDSFMKRESYEGPNDPRVISTIPGINKVNYSQFTYAFASHLKSMEWYAFGKTPLEIAKRVAHICSLASNVVMTDYSRFDGRVSKHLRLLEKHIMMRAFAPVYRSRLRELMTSQLNQRARTRFGVRYDTLDSRLSGSPETADFNSVDNAFVAFLAFRKTRENGLYLTKLQAWERLGIYGGDDGLTANSNIDLCQIC